MFLFEEKPVSKILTHSILFDFDSYTYLRTQINVKRYSIILIEICIVWTAKTIWIVPIWMAGNKKWTLFRIR